MSMRHPGRALALACIVAGAAAPASAYLFWQKPKTEGAPVVGNEPDVVIPLPGASPKEMRANLVWTMRGGLNVAALQCQFAPALGTVNLYNNLLHQHGPELAESYATLNAYFKRTGGKTWQSKFDQYTTRTYNSFSTLQAQLGFCEEAAAIGRETLLRPRGSLGDIAATYMRAFRNSLVPVGDAAFAFSSSLNVPDPGTIEEQCFDKKGRVKACKRPR